MHNDELISATGSTLTTALGIAAGDWVVLILGVISSIVTIAFTVWKWYKAAKADGKITKEEIEELIEDVKDDIDNIKR